MENRCQTVWMAVIVVGAVFLSSCGNPVPPLEVPQAVTVVDSKEFYPLRDRPAITVFKDKLWIIGNTATVDNTFTQYNDIWSSEDGIHWKKEVEDLFGDGRRAYYVVIFRGKLWAFGGFTKGPDRQVVYKQGVWASDDGVHWNKVVERLGYPPRHWASVFEFQGRLWMLGGGITDKDGLYDPTKEVWVSEDGLHWAKQAFSLPFFVDSSNDVFILSSDLMLFDMTVSLSTTKDFKQWEDLPKGNTYTEVLSFGERRPRFGPGTTVHNGYLYTMGGAGWPTHTEFYSDLLNDVWRTKDGATWERMTERDEEKQEEMNNFKSFPARVDPVVVSFRGMLYLFGGQGEGKRTGPDTWEPTNYRDAWVSPDGKDWYELARVREESVESK